MIATDELFWDFGESGRAKASAIGTKGLVQMIVTGLTSEQAINATLGTGTCREVYLLMATDIGEGREELLGVYATEEAAMAAINENKFGYALYHVRKWVVDE